MPGVCAYALVQGVDAIPVGAIMRLTAPTGKRFEGRVAAAEVGEHGLRVRVDLTVSGVVRVVSGPKLYKVFAGRVVVADVVERPSGFEITSCEFGGANGFSREIRKLHGGSVIEKGWHRSVVEALDAERARVAKVEVDVAAARAVIDRLSAEFAEGVDVTRGADGGA